MPNDTVGDYKEICAALKVKPLASPDLIINRTPGVVDVSSIYFPRKHLAVLLTLVSQHADLHTLILDQVDLHTEDIDALVHALKGSHVTSLSLRNVKLHPQSGELLKQLCRTNSKITSMCLEGSMLPEPLLESIALVVDLNRIACEAARLEAIPSLQHEAPKQPRQLLEGWSNDVDSVCGQKPSRAARDIVNEAMGSVAQQYIDADFSFRQKLLGREDIEYYRVMELADMFHVPVSECCSGSTPVRNSDIYDNRNLCAAINVLQQNTFLRNGLVCRAIPEFGLYGFRLFVAGEEVEILIDDVIPCLVKNGVAVPIGIYSANPDYWGPLAEKAFAKLVGSYSKISSVSFGEALATLTGGACMKIDWMPIPSKNSEALFELLRQLSLSKVTLINCAVPRTIQAKKALERIGIVTLAPYTLAQTGTYSHEDGFTVHLVQLVAPTQGASCEDCFVEGQFRTGELLGFPTFWMEFEHFATTFENSCALLWPHYDPLTSYLQSTTLPGVAYHSLFSCEFALNTAFLLRNVSTVEYWVRITLYRTDAQNSQLEDGAVEKPSVRLLGYRGTGDGQKRYALCEKNQLFSSSAACGKHQVFFITMKRGEAIQLTVSSSTRFNYEMTATAVDKLVFSVLPDRSHWYVSQGLWRAMFRNRRLPQEVYSFANVSSDTVTELLVAVEQQKTARPPFPISVIGWTNVSSKKVTPELEPEFHTETQNDYMSVWRISKLLRPGEEIILLPCCFDDWCDPSFRFAVYSDQELHTYKTILC